MLLFGVRRLLQSLPTVAGGSAVVFVLFSVIPGSIATSMFDDGRGAMDAEVVERMRKELGLDDPVYVRFGNYVSKLAVLDLGVSFRTREPVAQLLAKRLWPTFQLVVASMAFAIVIGVPLGFVAAMRPGGYHRRDLDVRRGLGPVDREVLVRPAADVPVRAEARLVSDLRLRRLEDISSCRRSRSASRRSPCSRARRAPPCSRW